MSLSLFVSYRRRRRRRGGDRQAAWQCVSSRRVNRRKFPPPSSRVPTQSARARARQPASRHRNRRHSNSRHATPLHATMMMMTVHRVAAPDSGAAPSIDTTRPPAPVRSGVRPVQSAQARVRLARPPPGPVAAITVSTRHDARRLVDEPYQERNTERKRAQASMCADAYIHGRACALSFTRPLASCSHAASNSSMLPRMR